MEARRKAKEGQKREKEGRGRARRVLMALVCGKVLMCSTKPTVEWCCSSGANVGHTLRVIA